MQRPASSQARQVAQSVPAGRTPQAPAPSQLPVRHAPDGHSPLGSNPLDTKTQVPVPELQRMQSGQSLSVVQPQVSVVSSQGCPLTQGFVAVPHAPEPLQLSRPLQNAPSEHSLLASLPGGWLAQT